MDGEQEKEEQRLKSEIAKVNRLIEPLEAQRNVLRRQLSEVQEAVALQANGFEKNEPLAYTVSLDRELHERRWSAYDIARYRDADVLRLEGLDTEHGTVYGSIAADGGVTGNIPLEILRDMKNAYHAAHGVH